MKNLNFRNQLAITILVSFIISASTGYFFSTLGSATLPHRINELKIQNQEKVQITQQESQIIKIVEKAVPSVVSIIVTKDVPKLEKYYFNPFQDDLWNRFFGNDDSFVIPQYRQKGTEKRQIGGGTGFVVGENLILTNKHVVSDQKADYTVLTNSEKEYTAKVLARDPVSDLAILKVENLNLKPLDLGDSSHLQVGQTVIAIGNALGEFSNSVSNGIISGLSRSIFAKSSLIGQAEELKGVIQTSAAINHGNSGGPLLNSIGQVIGINVAIAQGAENIGFAIPINDAKKVIKDVRENGKISYPFLGVRYVMITKTLQEEENLPYDHGALIISSQDGVAIIPDSSAEKAGLKERDIILEIDGKIVNIDNLLSDLILKHKIGETIKIKIWRYGKEQIIHAKLQERL
ncbi:hypothetical protein CL633_02245 [bacterium]|nr:hypothetical protein [bacterium]